jgi:hypothetical protein
VPDTRSAITLPDQQGTAGCSCGFALAISGASNQEKAMEKQNYYVFRHYDREDKTRYIGIGTGQRAWQTSHLKKAHKDWIKFYLQMGRKIEWHVDILHENLTRDQALQLKSYEMDSRRYEHRNGLFNYSNPSPYKGYVNAKRRPADFRKLMP